MIISDALRLAQQLQHSDSARLDAELLLAEALGKDRTYLYTWPERALSESEQALYQQWLQRRAEGEPVAHILQRREFWSLALEVDASTLIPRPDTEVLVEHALTLLAQHRVTSPRILDLGTGTGAIALALASELPQAQVIAVDVSAQAVALAQRNQQRLMLEHVRVFHSHWFDAVEGRFDLIVSNPPYIDGEDQHLQRGDVRFEPLSALVAGEGGIEDLAYIAKNASSYLNVGGWLLLEHGWQQGALVQQRLRAAGFSNTFTAQDYAGNDRVSGGQWHD